MQGGEQVMLDEEDRADTRALVVHVLPRVAEYALDEESEPVDEGPRLDGLPVLAFDVEHLTGSRLGNGWRKRESDWKRTRKWRKEGA